MKHRTKQSFKINILFYYCTRKYGASSTRCSCFGYPYLLARCCEGERARLEQMSGPFEAALMAKSSITVDELTRDAPLSPRRKELMGVLDGKIAQNQAVTSCTLSTGKRRERRYWTGSQISIRKVSL